ncbi:hypothetical protein [Psychrobacter jeotgali]|uniref:hypothetical protein n=1 Tax=Psychrobacter jeotgali TaxID=179010 RepID=UPI001917EA8B|nr:hypothetical protein [Psychrobacter jeotgali]
MSILIGVGIATTITAFYLGKKSWQAFHKAVGITPGVLTYQDPHAPVILSRLKWQQLNLNSQHLQCLSDAQLRQLQRIDDKLALYQRYLTDYQQHLTEQGRTPTVDEPQIVLQKLLYTRLPEILASYYYLVNNSVADNANATAQDNKQAEARHLLQQALHNIERRLDQGLEQMDDQHLQDLRVMKRYLDSRD